MYNNKQVDDTPYGGGAGMVLMCDPIFRCLDEIRTPKSHIIILSPEGSIYNEKKAGELSKYEDIILICGHYEGFDERIKTLADEIISVGDFVLTGGEIPAMLIADSIIRLLPGAITIIVPIIVGFVMGAEALGGYMAGVTVSGVLWAIFQSNAGGAWDNAKKFIESGKHGGKGSDAHSASIVGDTVGDPLKDTVGPSLDILIKIMAVISLIFVSVFQKYNFIDWFSSLNK